MGKDKENEADYTNDKRCMRRSRGKGEKNLGLTTGSLYYCSTWDSYSREREFEGQPKWVVFRHPSSNPCIRLTLDRGGLKGVQPTTGEGNSPRERYVDGRPHIMDEEQVVGTLRRRREKP